MRLAPLIGGIGLCADQKSQIQALDRTQSGLPLRRGRRGTLMGDLTGRLNGGRAFAPAE